MENNKQKTAVDSLWDSLACLFFFKVHLLSGRPLNNTTTTLMENNKQQTAVDWLWDQFINQGRTDYVQMHKEATEMFQGQIRGAWLDGNMLGRNGLDHPKYYDSKGYYEHTYDTKPID